MNKGQVQGETIEAPDVAQPKISTRKTVLLLAWPAILEQIMQTMVSYVDLAMVGSMGVNAAASVTINTSLHDLLQDRRPCEQKYRFAC